MPTEISKELKIAMNRVEKARRELKSASEALERIAAFYKIQ